MSDINLKELLFMRVQFKLVIILRLSIFKAIAAFLMITKLIITTHRKYHKIHSGLTVKTLNTI